MPSPFPGMNPYLEGPDHWPQFHDTFIMRMQSRLSKQLRPRYFVSMQRNVYIHEMPDEPGVRIGKPDLVIQRSSRKAVRRGTAVLESPQRARMAYPIEEIIVPYLAITDHRSSKIVTAIEVLSPSNKRPGGDRDLYESKRRELLNSPANFVEIDLLRGWDRMPDDDMPACDYCAMVSRPALRPELEVWPVNLREKLPTIPIPVRAGDVEPRIDLQELLHEVYDSVGFDLVAYRFPPEPPLNRRDRAWAKTILAGSRLG